MKKIAVTGGIASGKSTVCSILHSLGAYVCSSDDVVHSLLNLPSNIERVCQICGDQVLIDNKIDREKVANSVFSNPLKLKELENLLHPQALKEIKVKFEKVKSEGNFNIFVVEAPLLFEAGWEPFFDIVIAIDSEEESSKKRYIKSGHLESDFKRRRKRQLNEDQKLKRAHFILVNKSTIEELENETRKLFNHFS
ncbi:MAG: dephospho-CoA kinase [Rhabdochlamydiaceae bacterium]|nr:dephospho-CoA kinase [Candidatus Amphrikana amoebophyrae]